MTISQPQPRDVNAMLLRLTEVYAGVQAVAVRLIKDRGVCAKRRGTLKVHTSQLRDWVTKFSDDPQHAFPDNGQMKPEQLERHFN